MAATNSSGISAQSSSLSMTTSATATNSYTTIGSGTPSLRFNCSSNGKYILVGSQLCLSTNYGVSFKISTSDFTTAPTGGIVSSSGQYIYVAFNMALCASSNYGSTFISRYTINGVPDNSNYYTSLTCNSSGQHVFCTQYNGALVFSSDYGSTFTTGITLPYLDNMPVDEYDDRVPYYSGGILCLSGDASILYFTGSSMMNLMKSTDKGNTYTEIWSGAAYLTNQSCSVDGKYVIFSSFNPSQVYLSSNYGSSFSVVLTTTTNNYFQGASVSSTGQYQFCSYSNYSQAKSYLMFSTNYGVTWNTQTSNGVASTMFQSGNYLNNQYIFESSTISPIALMTWGNNATQMLYINNFSTL